MVYHAPTQRVSCAHTLPNRQRHLACHPSRTKVVTKAAAWYIQLARLGNESLVLPVFLAGEFREGHRGRHHYPRTEGKWTEWVGSRGPDEAALFLLWPRAPRRIASDGTIR